MLNGRSIIVSLSIIIIVMMMMMMTEYCDGSMAACNGSTSTECRLQGLEEEEQELLMDTEEHRRILATTYGNRVSYDSLQPGNSDCGKNCAGSYNLGNRKCKSYDYSCK